MKRTFVALAIVTAVSLGILDRSTTHPTVVDRAEVVAVIEAQIEAFLSDDAVTAFRFASDELRQEYGTPDQFMETVRTEYAAVYRPMSFSFTEINRIGNKVAQSVRFIGPDGHGYEAVYLMEMTPIRTWRIDDVTLNPTGDRGA